MGSDVTFWAVSEHATAAGVQRELQLQHFAVSQGPAWFQFGRLYQDARLHLPDEPRASWDYFFAALVWDARSAEPPILRNLGASDVTSLAAVVGFLWARYHVALVSALARTIATDDHAWFTVPTALSFVEDLRTLTLDAAHHGEGVLIVAGAALPGA